MKPNLKTLYRGEERANVEPGSVAESALLELGFGGEPVAASEPEAVPAADPDPEPSNRRSRPRK